MGWGHKALLRGSEKSQAFREADGLQAGQISGMQTACDPGMTEAQKSTSTAP